MSKLLLTLTCALVASNGVASQSSSDRAREVHSRALVLDTHADTTQQMIFEAFDLGARASTGHVDIPRMREGGVDAVFFSIWMPGTLSGPDVVKRSLQQIDAVREQVRRHPDDLVLATAASEVREAQREGKIAALMGMEGGHMIDDDLAVLRMYRELGVRYLTLTHFQNNHWADASTEEPEHNGLTDFGKDVVRELNRLGVMVDISHVSDKTFYDALEVSRAPLMASHSSCRSLSDHPRNMSDDMIKALAAKGGVIQINYEITFLSQKAKDAKTAQGWDVTQIVEALSERCGDNLACEIREGERLDREAMERGELPQVSWTEIVDHIDHVVTLVGPEHVGLGSDFDGASMPLGMDDISNVPRLTGALLEKGYREEDIVKILGGNLLRVMEETERVAASMR
ncbi:MAG TPA: dipeptidase [Vicinamibacteria bacterium]|nr:dipeptidase [Vicinamibacteria bacterium]